MASTTIDFTKANPPAFPFSLGDASGSYVGRIVFQIVGGGTFSFTPKARLRGASIANGSLVSVPYTNRGTGASVAAGTAITAAGLYEVDATGVEVTLDGSYTSGACAVYPQPLEG